MPRRRRQGNTNPFQELSPLGLEVGGVSEIANCESFYGDMPHRAREKAPNSKLNILRRAHIMTLAHLNPDA